MKPLLPHLLLLTTLGFSLGLSELAVGHDLASDDPHPHYDRSVKPPELLFAQATVPQNRAGTGARAVRTNRPAQAVPFEAFAPKVSVRWDERFLYVESNGLPAHNMMVGITAWQQQVPLPQNYTGTNAWQIPLAPVPAKEPASIRNRFLRGAIALAVNGIPIFNPQNNRGEVSQEIGELDEWGGHCGRADDYHYHAAPLHLQTVAGKGQPIAFALDGYAIYGLTEPDGAQPAGLDAFNGHTTQALGYHYHGSTKYPYVNGGFHGEVTERDGQVDPQPRANPVREALPALRGAKITGFESTGADSYRLTYSVNGDRRAVLYSIRADGTFPFEFQNGSAGTTKQTYTLRQRGGGGGGPRPDGERPPRRPGEGQNAGGPDRPPRPEDGPGGPRPRESGAREAVSQFGPEAMKKPDATFLLTSPEVKDGGALPVDYTGDGSGATLPLSWKEAPAGTKSYALIMDHLAPGNVMKHYWTMWDIPATTTSLPKNVQGVGKLGTSFKGQIGYEPPHSQGPGAKTYVLTVYALSSPLQIAQQPREVNRDVLLAAMKDKVLASSSLSVVYTRSGSASGEGQRPPRRENGNDRPSQAQVPEQTAPRFAAADQPPQQGQPGERRPGGPGGGKGGGKPDNKGLIKPTMADTIKVNIYADNWFVLFINGELVAVDSIKFTPHNVVSVDILPEYPMTIAVMAKDNADPKTGLEYGDHIGDGGFIIKFADGTVSDAKWKAKNFFKGPLNHDAANPKVEHTPIPDGWWKTDFDDSKWANATEYTEERVNPKQPYYEADFKGAKFIWSEDLDLDNTIIFRTKVEKPGWTKRWNTKPDLDVTGAPFK
jgi:phosphatidylethanolamine-binding protein (PEBP) family uncharacterized protein